MDLKSFALAMDQIAEEKGIPREKIIETIEMAIAAAYKKDYGRRGQMIRAEFSPESGAVRFFRARLVVDESMVRKEEEELNPEEQDTDNEEKDRAKKTRSGEAREKEEKEGE